MNRCILSHGVELRKPRQVVDHRTGVIYRIFLNVHLLGTCIHELSHAFLYWKYCHDLNGYFYVGKASFQFCYRKGSVDARADAIIAATPAVLVSIILLVFILLLKAYILIFAIEILMQLIFSYLGADGKAFMRAIRELRQGVGGAR